ncbi:formyl peptide receptor-related sequence 1-like [Ascaphus truei]|uniref:formyl peptide receptor-related sequence 1-like n=1 Tax=Ascaphus truei TaxID=8439 RepID=UPI003F59AF27
METSVHPVPFTISSPETSVPEEDLEKGFLFIDIFHLMQVICIICFSITFILGIIGNGLVIWIAGFKMKKTVNTIWFLNLAVANFVFNIFLPLQITEFAMDGHWPFGRIMCTVISTAIYLNMLVSVSFLMVISVDRCTSTLCPVWSNNHRTPMLASIISIVIWELCLIPSSPYLAFYDTEHDPEHDPDENISICYIVYVSWNNGTTFDYLTWSLRNNAMSITQFVSMFLIPFSIILVCYGLIALRLRRSKSLSRSWRPFKVMIAIVLCFFCCWFPFNFWPLLKIMDIETDWTFDFLFLNISSCLAFFNSCLNPLLYVFIGRDLKETLNKSIPFILENTFSERCDLDFEGQDDQIMVETELETFQP